MNGRETQPQKQVKEPRPIDRGSLNSPPSGNCLGGAPLTILLFLLVILSRILPAGVNVPLLLLASLTGLSGLSRLLSLAVLALALLALSLAVLATLLLILLHIVCHGCSSVFAERVLARRRGINDWHLLHLPMISCHLPAAGLGTIFLRSRQTSW